MDADLGCTGRVEKRDENGLVLSTENPRLTKREIKKLACRLYVLVFNCIVVSLLRNGLVPDIPE